MARSAAPQSLGNDSEASIGDLVAQAIRDVTQLVRCELALAKLELLHQRRAKRLGLAAALLGITAFTCCLIVVLVSFAFAYGLVTLGIGSGPRPPSWPACGCCWPRSRSSS